MAPMAPALYVQLLAGPTLPLDTLFNTLSDKTKTGYAAAATVGVVVAKGVSLEADGLYTKRDFANAAGSVTTVTPTTRKILSFTPFCSSSSVSFTRSAH